MLSGIVSNSQECYDIMVCEFVNNSAVTPTAGGDIVDRNLDIDNIYNLVRIATSKCNKNGKQIVANIKDVVAVIMRYLDNDKNVTIWKSFILPISYAKIATLAFYTRRVDRLISSTLAGNPRMIDFNEDGVLEFVESHIESIHPKLVETWQFWCDVYSRFYSTLSYVISNIEKN
jgi:hypothetical protein